MTVTASPAALAGALALAALVGAGCEPAPQPDLPFDSAATATLPRAELQVADTTADAVWAHLDSVDYRQAWSNWPDRPSLYQGQDPHGMLLTTYLNTHAAQGLSAMKLGAERTLPFGSIIVKENYSSDTTLVATTVMYKQRGYDPDHHDWFWLKRLADGTIEAAGRAEGCISCHGDAAEQWDYLMTARADAEN